MPPTRHQVSAAAHANLPHANPLSTSQMAELAEWAVRWRPSTAIDIGCGPGSFSVAVAARSPVSVRAIDLNSAFLERARTSARSTTLVGSIDFVECPLQLDEDKKFDVVVCLGSSGSVGSPIDALKHCKKLMAPTGTLVFAELVWTSKPTEVFLAFLGVDSAYYWSQSEGERVLAQHGLAVVHQCAASTSSWASYERAVLDGRLKLAASLEADADAAEPADAIRNRARTWYTNYENHGRHCLGFSAYVARHAMI